MTSQNQGIESIDIQPSPFDVRLLVENGESPTAFILALSILIGVLLSGVTRLATTMRN